MIKNKYINDIKMCHKCKIKKHIFEYYLTKFGKPKQKCKDCNHKEYEIKNKQKILKCIEKEKLKEKLKMLTEKQCKTCLEYKATDKFQKKQNNLDGLDNICAICKNKSSKESKTKYYEKNKKESKERAIKFNNNKIAKLQKIVNKIKINKGCIDCGLKENPECLDFDHINDKILNISFMVSRRYKLEQILQEIEKCEIRCANCHRRKTAKEQNWYYDILYPDKFIIKSNYKNKKFVYNIIINGNGCVDCGLKDIECLEFDHKTRDDKIINISRAKQSLSIDKLINEINKCEIRCANCHRLKHAKELGYYKYVK